MNGRMEENEEKNDAPVTESATIVMGSNITA